MPIFDEIEVRVYRSYVKIPLIFFVPALTLVTGFLLAYFHVNSQYFWRFAEDQLHETMEGHYSFEYLEISPSLTTVRAYGAELQTPDRRPVIELQQAKAVLNPWMLFAKRVELTRLEADGVKVWLELRDGRLSIFEALGRYDRPETDGEGPEIGLTDIEIRNGEFEFVAESFGFSIGEVEIPQASFFVGTDTTMITVDEVAIPHADFWFRHHLFRFYPEHGDWEFEVTDFEIDDWRWINGGFRVDRVAAEMEGIGVEATGRMEFPGSEGESPMVYDASGTLWAAYHSTALEYFTGGHLRFDFPRLDVEIAGDLNDIEGEIDAHARLVQLNGMFVEDLRGKVQMRNRFLTAQEVTGRFYEGDVVAENVMFSMFDRFYGAELHVDGVNPRAMLRDMVLEDHPFVDGEVEGSMRLMGEIPQAANPRPAHNYILATDALARFVDAEVMEGLTLRRRNDLLFPNARLDMEPGSKFFVDQRRMGLPHATITAGEDQVELAEFYLTYPDMYFTSLVGSRPARISGRFEEFGPYATYYNVDGLEGPAEFAMTMEGFFGSPLWRLSAHMDEPRWRVSDEEVFEGERLELELATEDGEISIEEAWARSEMGNFTASGWVGWYEPPPRERGDPVYLWEDRQVQPLDVGVDISGLELAAVSHLIHDELDARGRVDARLDLRGTMQALEGGFRAEMEDGYVREQWIKEAEARGAFDGTGAILEKGEVDLGEAGKYRGKGRYGYDSSFSFELDGEEIDLAELRELDDMEAIPGGKARFYLDGRGTLAQPVFSGGGQIRELTVDGRPYGDVAFAADTIDDVVYLSGGLLPWLTTAVEIPLDINRPVYARFGMEDLALMDFLPELQESPMLDDARVTGVAELFMERDFENYQAIFNLEQMSIDSRGQRIVNRDPVVVGLNNGEVVTFEQAGFESGGHAFDLAGAVALNPVLLDLQVEGDFDLALLDSARAGFPEFFPEYFVDAQGKAKTDLTIRGTPEHYVADGTIDFDRSQWELRFLPEPVELEGGRINLGDRGIEIPEDAPLHGTALGGPTRVAGRLGYLPEHPREMDIQVWSHNMSYRFPDLATLVFDTNLRLQAEDWHDWESWLISGDMDILDGVYEQEFNFVEQELAGRVMGAFQPQTARYEAGLFELFPSLNDIRFDMNVRARDGFHVRTSLDRMSADLEFRFNLLIQDTLVDPRVSGDLDVLGGDVTFQGEAFEVRGGSVRFEEDLSNPHLDIQAGADVRNTCEGTEFLDEVSPAMTLSSAMDQADMQYYHVMLSIEGYLENLNLQLESNPYADQRDILSMLLTGCTVDQLTATGASRPTLEVALGPLLGRLEREIQDVVAVDEFTIMPGVERTQVHIGDTLTRRLSWRFHLDTGFAEATGGQQYQLEYRLSDHWTAEMSERSHVETDNFLLDLKLNYRLPLD